jgi:hypothetical protein
VAGKGVERKEKKRRKKRRKKGKREERGKKGREEDIRENGKDKDLLLHLLIEKSFLKIQSQQKCVVLGNNY